jgi:thioredoxin 1
MKSLWIARSWPIVAIVAIVAGVAARSHLSANSILGGACLLGGSASSRTEGETEMQTSTKIEHLQRGDFEEAVLRSKIPVLVDFYADWCPPCRALAPVLERFAVETPHAKIVKVNVDENPELAAQYQIDSIPSLLVFRDNRLTGRHVGLANKALLRQLLSP